MIAGRFRVGRMLGEGSYGCVFAAHDEVTDQPVALKLESSHGKQGQLRYEFEVLRYVNKKLQEGSPPAGETPSPPARWKETKVPDAGFVMEVPPQKRIEGIPAVWWYGGHGSHKVMALEPLGPSLGSLMTSSSSMNKQRQPILSLHTVLMVGVQIVSRIEALHRCGILHRDIKPQNFCMGQGKYVDTVYAIDMGLSKPWAEGESNSHIKMVTGKKLAGTARYSSIATHQGYEQGRRDDLECVAYVLVYLNAGTLPWQGIQAGDKKKRNRLIGEKKLAYPLEELCKDVPELETFIKYCQSLGFTDEPDYEHLRGLLYAALKRNGWEMDNNYDWKT